MSSSEHLDSHDGASRPVPTDGRGRRTAWVVGGAVAVLGVVGGGAWAAMSFLQSGPQAAEALPASTLAYASIDLDPSGGQKIEALRMLRKFPVLRKELGVDSTDDVRRLVFEGIQEDGVCPDLDYARDVEPWLGDRMAVAAVDTGGSGGPAPVVVLQVSDDDAARSGLTKFIACADTTADEELSAEDDAAGDLRATRDPVAFEVSDGWALVGAAQDVVDSIARDAATSSLADDATYQRWTGEAGDPGIATFYVSPAAGDVIAEQLGTLGGVLGSGPEAYVGSSSSADSGWSSSSASAAPMAFHAAGPDSATRALEDFGGLAATLRFDGAGLELEMAADAEGQTGTFAGSDDGTAMVRSLPADTVAAAGFGLRDGWFSALVDQLAAPTGMSPDRLVAQMERESGLDLPADAETLAGDSLALAVGSGFDARTFFSSDSPAGLPIGLKVHGDGPGIERVLDKVRAKVRPGSAEAELLASSQEGDVVAVGPSEDYRTELLDDGGLGAAEAFRDVVRESDRASGIVYVSFDAGGWLDGLAEDDPDAAANLRPLQALGMSTWLDGTTGHAVLRLTTD